MSNEKEDKTVTSASLISQHLNANLSNYILLILAVILIGVFSPTGLPRALLTGIVLYLYTFSIYCSSGIIKPLANFLTKAGKTKLFNTEFLGFSYVFGWLLWLLACNYFLHRYTGVSILDNFVIIFWIMLYTSIHVLNFSFLKTSKRGGRELIEMMDILTNKHDSKKVSNMGQPKLNIIFSVTAVLVGLFIARQTPYLITIPEDYLKNAEDLAIYYTFPNTNVQRYSTKL